MKVAWVQYSYNIGTTLYISHNSLPHAKTYTTYSKLYDIIPYHVRYYCFLSTSWVAWVQYSYNIGTTLYISHNSLTHTKTYTTYSKLYNIIPYHVRYYCFLSTSWVAWVQYYSSLCIFNWHRLCPLLYGGLPAKCVEAGLVC